MTRRNIEQAISDSYEEAFAELDAATVPQRRRPAVTFEHPRNRAERAAWAEKRAAIEALGLTVEEVPGERPDKPEYRVEFASRAEQIGFLRDVR